MLRRRSTYSDLFWLLILTGVFNVIDFFNTRDLVVYGIHSEWNPFMRILVGTPYFAIYKLVLIPLGLAVLWRVRKSLMPRYLGLIRLTCVVYALVITYTWVVFYA